MLTLQGSGSQDQLKLRWLSRLETLFIGHSTNEEDSLGLEGIDVRSLSRLREVLLMWYLPLESVHLLSGCALHFRLCSLSHLQLSNWLPSLRNSNSIFLEVGFEEVLSLTDLGPLNSLPQPLSCFTLHVNVFGRAESPIDLRGSCLARAKQLHIFADEVHVKVPRAISWEQLYLCADDMGLHFADVDRFAARLASFSLRYSECTTGTIESLAENF